MDDDYRSKELIIHAPGVHVGGGLVLLKALLLAVKVSLVNIDSRAFFPLQALADRVSYIKPTLLSRFFAEFRLWQQVKEGDTILCFHGLPPIFPLSGIVIVFVQNRLLLGEGKLDGYPFRTRLRLTLERLWLRTFKGHGQRYIVQTQTMAITLQNLLGPDSEISIKPFATREAAPQVENFVFPESSFDFVYIADGEPHKNHLVLLLAWQLLAKAGLKPSLALTVDLQRHPQVAAEIEKAATNHVLSIINLGHLPIEEIEQLYQRSSALIYPSLTESFGLPLIEANRHGLAVLAPELDYVRDVVVPVETFDPNSPLSIARAVRRFLGKGEPVASVCSAEEFVAEVMR